MIPRRTLLAAPLLAAPARAQESYPSRSVGMVVGFPPGGQADVAARPVAAALERLWRVPVPVSNRAGAAGELGNAYVARSAPDGHTLLMALSSVVLLPAAARVNGRTPAYEVDQLTPVALFSADPTVLVVPAASPFRTLDDFLAAARARPEAVSFSSAGTYSALHMPMAMLALAAGLRLLHVPFQGGGPALTALLSGQVDALASGPGPAAPHVREGRLRALACWGRERLAAFPDVPTLLERGFADVEFAIWTGVCAPAATPTPILARLRESLAAVARDPEVARVFAAGGNTLDHRDGEAFAALWRADTQRLGAVVARIGRTE